MKRTPLTVHAVGDDPTVRFAAEELAKYAGMMSGAPTSVSSERGYRMGAKGLWTGVAAAFGRDCPAIPPVAEARFDDAIGIAARGLDGIIAGSNPRSALLAVYRYLTDAGCAWVRPGPDGEYVPRRDLASFAETVSEAASYRHRGICIEGAVSDEHVRDIIAWMPRNGFNAYFIQFREGFTFYDRWYSRMGDPLRKPEPFSVERARELVARAEAEIVKRGLIYHAVGHGWTCEPFGIRGLGWEYPPEPVPAAVQRYLALVKGVRELWGGVPLNTNLCYSNPEVRRLMAEDIARYAVEHPAVDLLHVWLADGSNNACECEGCSAARPSDFYVQILNEADRLLTERKLRTRIVFLIYVDLLWPPERERLANPDRFVLMFAPITRTYSAAFTSDRELPALPPFRRNELVFPRDVAANLAFLAGWRKVFAGDSFDFDYHFMWDHYNDPGSIASARILHADITLLSRIGLAGLVSCQTQRAFFPTGLGMWAMGRTLWNARQGFDAMADAYFAAAFGDDGRACRQYLERLSELFDPPYLRGEKPDGDRAAVESLAKVAPHVAAFRPVIERRIRAETDPCRKVSWEHLAHHADLVERLAEALRLRAEGRADEARAAWETVALEAWKRQDALHRVLDTYLFTRTVGQKFAPKKA